MGWWNAEKVFCPRCEGGALIRSVGVDAKGRVEWKYHCLRCGLVSSEDSLRKQEGKKRG